MRNELEVAIAEIEELAKTSGRWKPVLDLLKFTLSLEGGAEYFRHMMTEKSSGKRKTGARSANIEEARAIRIGRLLQNFVLETLGREGGDQPEDPFETLRKRALTADTTHEAIVGSDDAKPVSPKRRKGLPEAIPQPTYKEATTPARALADGPTGRRWEPVSGEIALRHVIPGEPLHTKIVAGPSLDWWGIPATNESLKQELAQAGTDSVFVFYELLGLAASCDGQATVALDDLITVTWDRPRSTRGRLERRRVIWRWLALFEHTYVIGARRGTYQHRDTGKVVDTVSADPLFRVVGREYPVTSQQELDLSEPPLEVSIVAGRWLDQFRGNRKVLSNFGDIRRIGAIPPGKPSGEWARCIGLALNQRWREMAARAEVQTENHGHPAVQYPEAFSRRELLSMFPPKRSRLEEVLESDDPGRACKYWDEAIRLLKTAGVIKRDGYRELKKLPRKRKGWQDDWLDQPLEILPADEGAAATAEIAEAANRARSRRSPRKGN